MPEYLAPGVYVEEVDTGNKPIEGVSTSTAGLVGVTERGPVGVPIFVTSYGEFERIFGGKLNHLFYLNPHNYLPHAVEGFFTNGGQRLFIVRVLDSDGAVRAITELFDRGNDTSANTRLLRGAAESSGTPASPPLLYVLDASNLSLDDWFRIGEGSKAEYRRVLDLPGSHHVMLDLPLLRSHDAGVAAEQFTPDTSPGYTAAVNITLVNNTNPGAPIITVEDADAANISQLYNEATSANGQLLAIGATNLAEYRFAIAATIDPANPNRLEVQLDAGLALAHDAGSALEPLDILPPAAGSPESGLLETARNAGSGLIFLQDRAGVFNTITDLVVINRTDLGLREVRRISELGEINISTVTYESYPSGSFISAVQLADLTVVTDPPRVIANAGVDLPVGSEIVPLDDISSLQVGDVLRIGNPGSTEDRVILKILGNNIEIAQLNNPHPDGAPVVRLEAHLLTGEASEFAQTISLDSRAGLTPGQLLQIGQTPNEEYITIEEIPGQNPDFLPDPGNVLLTHPLQHAHPEDAIVYLQETPTVVAGTVPMATVLEAASGDATIIVSGDSGYAVGTFVEIQTPGNEFYYHRISDGFQAATNIRQVELHDPVLAHSHAMNSLIVGRAPLLEIQALDAGQWGNRLRITIEHEEDGLVQGTQLQSANVSGFLSIHLDSPVGVEPGTILELYQPDQTVVGTLLKVDAIDRRTGEITLAGTGLDAAQLNALLLNPLQVRSREFRMTVNLLRQPDPAIPTRNETIIDSELFRHLSMDPRHSRYIELIPGSIDGNLREWDRRPEGQSLYIRVRDLETNPINRESVRLGPDLLVDLLPSGQESPGRRSLINGFDSLNTIYAPVNQYVGIDAPEPENRTGIHSLRNYEEISLIASPGQTRTDIQQALIQQCESMRYRFTVLDGPPPPDDTLTDVRSHRQQFDTKYAALYHPWVQIWDPYPQNLDNVREYPIPPSGHTLGIYARTDIERGVHKAPANEVVRGVLGLQRILNKREHDILNPFPVNINVIRDFRRNNRGIRIWGGRVITSDPDWKYVNVRRLMIFLEASIDRGLQWVVFEPNAEPLWARVRRTIINFLTTVWRNGALEGTKPEEAFFVKCDRTTMTQTDIDNGSLIILIGVAPVKPAEFVIVRIGLWTAFANDN